MKYINQFIQEKLVINSKSKIDDGSIYVLVYPREASVMMYLVDHFKDRIITSKLFRGPLTHQAISKIYYILSDQEIKDIQSQNNKFLGKINIYLLFDKNVITEKDVQIYIKKYKDKFNPNDLVMLKDGDAEHQDIFDRIYRYKD